MRFRSRFIVLSCCSLLAVAATVHAQESVGTSTIRMSSTVRAVPRNDEVEQAGWEERSLPVITLTAGVDQDAAPQLPRESAGAFKAPPTSAPPVPAAPSRPRPMSAQQATTSEDGLSSVKLPLHRGRKPTNVVVHPVAEPQVTSQTRQALNFYGGTPARATLSQFPRRTPIQAAPAQPIRHQIKPFNTIYREPTVSPYLNLYRQEDDTESAPNFYAFVRPQQEQIEANRFQQGEIQHLTRQLQNRSTTVAVPRRGPASLPGTGTPARYRDTAQFYGGWSP